jgi:N4-gp56 family major capsid protein
MADQLIGNTEVAAVKQALIASVVQRELQAAAMVGPTVWDVSQFAEPGALSIAFPRSTSFSVEKKISGQKASAQALTLSTDTMNLNQHAVVQWVIEKSQSVQSRVNLELLAAQRAASAHARQVDSDIISSIDSNRSTGNDVTFSSAITLANINEMRRNLSVANWPAENRTLLIHPAQEEDLLNIANFIQADQYGGREALLNGEIGRIFGVRVVVSNLVTEDQAYMYHRDAAAVGFQQMPEFAEQPDLENLGMRFSVDQLYGVVVTQSGTGISRCA